MGTISEASLPGSGQNVGLEESARRARFLLNNGWNVATLFTAVEARHARKRQQLGSDTVFNVLESEQRRITEAELLLVSGYMEFSVIVVQLKSSSPIGPPLAAPACPGQEGI